MSESIEIRIQPLVLIADDDASARLVMRNVLEQSGFDVIEAADGKEALQIYESTAPNVVLTDIGMPDYDGLSVCEAIRQKEPCRKTPICIVTELADDNSVDRAYEAGATDFIGKPITWTALPHRLRYLLRTSEALNDVRSLLMALPDSVFVLDEHGRTFEESVGANVAAAIGIGSMNGLTFEDIVPVAECEKVRKCIELALLSDEPQIHEFYFARGDVHLEARFVARDKLTVLAVVRDVTERKKAELQIYDLAFYDKLTGLPNRQLFSKELENAVREARKQKSEFAILFVDLDRFKRINDTLGHSMGDELLKAVAARLHGCVRPEDRLVHSDRGENDHFKLARLGGDEFVLILHDVDSEDDAASIASRIISALSVPFSCGTQQFVITPSIGIALYPQDGASNDELLMNVDSAMYKAKAAGRNTFQFYSGTMKVRSLQRLDMENELRQALDKEQFDLHYQPKVDVFTGRIVGAEALLRWHHEERGWISPADFVPIAEETGIILPLGRWVMEKACRRLSRWQHSELRQIVLSVNVSSQQVFADDLVDIVTSAVDAAGVGPEMLELEITESLLMRDIESTIAALNTLKKLGVYLSIDDFGTGYSSLSYLKRFPIDALKIDRSFVKDLHTDSDDAAICAAIIAMAQNLDLKVVAEGVELKEQLNFLRKHGCDQIQGYLISKPLPAEEFEALARKQFSSSVQIDMQSA